MCSAVQQSHLEAPSRISGSFWYFTYVTTSTHSSKPSGKEERDSYFQMTHFHTRHHFFIYFFLYYSDLFVCLFIFVGYIVSFFLLGGLLFQLSPWRTTFYIIFFCYRHVIHNRYLQNVISCFSFPFPLYYFSYIYLEWVDEENLREAVKKNLPLCSREKWSI